MKYVSLLYMLPLLLIGGCSNKQQFTKTAIDNLMVGKWKMIEYADGYVNALDTLSFHKNGKTDSPPETCEFTYRLIKPDSLIIYNKGFGEQHYKILKLSNDSLIKQLRRQRIYADNIDKPINGEIEKYIRVTDR